MLRSKIRKATGAGALVEGVVGLMLVIGGTILAGLLLFNSGAATLNRERIGFVANQAAVYAASLPADGARQGLVNTRVDELLTSTGLRNATRTVTISDLTLISRPAVKVSLNVTFPTYLSGNFGNVLPQQIQMSDTAVALHETPFWGYGVGLHPLGMRFTAPIVNATGLIPLDNLPAWSVLVPVNMWQIRF